MNMNRRSARNRHRPEPLTAIPQVKKHFVNAQDFAELVALGSQIIPKFHAQAMANSAEASRAGVPSTIVGILAGSGATARAVAEVIAKHVPAAWSRATTGTSPARRRGSTSEPKPGDDLRQVFPAWAVDILVVLGVLEPEKAEPAPSEAVADEAETLPKPVEDELDLAQRAAAVDLVIAS
jgi:hypothetical protein